MNDFVEQLDQLLTVATSVSNNDDQHEQSASISESPRSFTTRKEVVK